MIRALHNQYQRTANLCEISDSRLYFPEGSHLDSKSVFRFRYDGKSERAIGAKRAIFCIWVDHKHIQNFCLKPLLSTNVNIYERGHDARL
jgi:hypothetical protein